MKAKTNERRKKKEERLKKKEENKQAVSNQTEVFMKALMNLESQFKQHESMRAVMTKELESAKSENEVLRASLQAIQSHLTKVKSEIDDWVQTSAVVSGDSLVSLQKVIFGLLTNPADMPMIELRRSSSVSTPPIDRLEITPPASTNSSAVPVPPPPPAPGAPPPPPPPGTLSNKRGSTQILSPPVAKSRPGSTQIASSPVAGRADLGSMSFLDSIRSGTSLKKIDRDELAKEKKQASVSSGFAQTLEETMKIAMELRKKAMEAQDSDEDDDDDDEDEDDDDWYSDDD
eukprot:TRINITY_DN345_c1_g1_i1.p1 TRINITY_DN345_c1_g1~~TRINITY_DN345_c1_g1_i1.p1  ORF type:complete len:288 (+),score=99.94 TRINITY_DN345_c1_g1_i1:1161-2024(+)